MPQNATALRKPAKALTIYCFARHPATGFRVPIYRPISRPLPVGTPTASPAGTPGRVVASYSLQHPGHAGATIPYAVQNLAYCAKPGPQFGVPFPKASLLRDGQPRRTARQKWLRAYTWARCARACGEI